MEAFAVDAVQEVKASGFVGGTLITQSEDLLIPDVPDPAGNSQDHARNAMHERADPSFRIPNHNESHLMKAYLIDACYPWPLPMHRMLPQVDPALIDALMLGALRSLVRGQLGSGNGQGVGTSRASTTLGYTFCFCFACFALATFIHRTTILPNRHTSSKAVPTCLPEA